MNFILFLYLVYKYKISYKQMLLYLFSSLFIVFNFSKLDYILFSYLLFASFVDYNVLIIPDTTHVFLLTYILLTTNNLYIDNILGSIIITIPFLIIYYTKKGIGFGDIKLVIFLGYILGVANSIYMLNISVSFILLNIVIHKLMRIKINSKFAFGPYLIFSFTILFLSSH